MAYPATARHVQDTFRRLKGQADSGVPDFISTEDMEWDMKDLF